MNQISLCICSQILRLRSKPFFTWSLFTEVSSACNWKQTSQSPASNTEQIFCDCRFLFSFCFVFWCVVFFSFFFLLLGEIKDLRQWISPVLFPRKTSELFFSAELFILCLHRIIELNQSANEFRCSYSSCFIPDRKQSSC